MTSLVEDLPRIETALGRLGRVRLTQQLNPGLNPSDAAQRLSAAGFGQSNELEELYAWHNGTSTVGVTLDDIQMFPGFYLLSLEDAIADYVAFAADSRWSRGWLPLFANGGGDFYVIDLARGAAGEIRHFRIDEDAHPVEFSSLSDLVTTLVAAFDRHVFFVDPDGYLEMDDLQFADLANEFNPSVRWWAQG